jgi:hypothetical protein
MHDREALALDGRPHGGDVVDDEAEMALGVARLPAACMSAMNWSPMSMKAAPGMRPRNSKSNRRAYSASAASRSPTSSAT